MNVSCRFVTRPDEAPRPLHDVHVDLTDDFVGFSALKHNKGFWVVRSATNSFLGLIGSNDASRFLEHEHLQRAVSGEQRVRRGQRQIEDRPAHVDDVLADDLVVQGFDNEVELHFVADERIAAGDMLVEVRGSSGFRIRSYAACCRVRFRPNSNFGCSCASSGISVGMPQEDTDDEPRPSRRGARLSMAVAGIRYGFRAPSRPLCQSRRRNWFPDAARSPVGDQEGVRISFQSRSPVGRHA